MAMAQTKKVRVGVSFDNEVAALLEQHARQLKGLGVNRSEIVNAVLEEFFEDGSSTEIVWEVVSRRRAKLRTG